MRVQIKPMQNRVKQTKKGFLVLKSWKGFFSLRGSKYHSTHIIDFPSGFDFKALVRFFGNDTRTSNLEEKLRIPRIPFVLEIPGETVQWLLKERNAELIKTRLLGKLMMVLHAKEKEKKKGNLSKILSTLSPLLSVHFLALQFTGSVAINFSL